VEILWVTGGRLISCLLVRFLSNSLKVSKSRKGTSIWRKELEDVLVAAFASFSDAKLVFWGNVVSFSIWQGNGMCGAENWLVNQEGHVTPLTNKGLLFGIIKGNQWLISPYFLGGNIVEGRCRWTSHQLWIKPRKKRLWFEKFQVLRFGEMCWVIQALNLGGCFFWTSTKESPAT